MSLAQEIKRLEDAKADIKDAIEEKGVAVGDGTLDTYPEKIAEISGGGGIEDVSYLKIIEDNNTANMGARATFSATPYSVALHNPNNYVSGQWTFPLQDDGTAYPALTTNATTYADPIDLGDFATADGKRVELVINDITCPVYMPGVCTSFYSSKHLDLAKGLIANIHSGAVVDIDFTRYVVGASQTVDCYPGAYKYGSPTSGRLSGKIYYVAVRHRNHLLAEQITQPSFVAVLNVRGLTTIASSGTSTQSLMLEYVTNPSDLRGYIYGTNYTYSGAASLGNYITIFIPNGRTLEDFEQELKAKNEEISAGEVYICMQTPEIMVAQPSVFATAVTKAKQDGYAILTNGTASKFNLGISTISSNELHLSEFVDNSKLVTFNYSDDASGVWDEPHTALLMTNDDLDLSGIDSVSNSRW